MMPNFGRNWIRTAGLIACGVMASLAGANSASAQTYRGNGYDRGYERRDSDWDRRGGAERRYDDRRRGNDYDRGRNRRDSFDPRGPRPGYNPMAGTSLQDQKRAVKNHREMQKKAIKRGYVIP